MGLRIGGRQIFGRPAGAERTGGGPLSPSDARRLRRQVSATTDPTLRGDHRLGPLLGSLAVVAPIALNQGGVALAEGLAANSTPVQLTDKQSISLIESSQRVRNAREAVASFDDATGRVHVPGSVLEQDYRFLSRIDAFEQMIQAPTETPQFLQLDGFDINGNEQTVTFVSYLAADKTPVIETVSMFNTVPGAHLYIENKADGSEQAVWRIGGPQGKLFATFIPNVPTETIDPMQYDQPVVGFTDLVQINPDYINSLSPSEQTQLIHDIESDPAQAVVYGNQDIVNRGQFDDSKGLPQILRYAASTPNGIRLVQETKYDGTSPIGTTTLKVVDAKTGDVLGEVNSQLFAPVYQNHAIGGDEFTLVGIPDITWTVGGSAATIVTPNN